MTPRISTLALWRSFRRILSVLVLLAVLVLGTAAAIVVQAGRSDSSAAAAAIVVLGNAGRGAAARLDQARQLYIQGDVSRLILLGADASAGRDTLLSRGIQPEAVAFFDQGTQPDQIAAAKHMLDRDGLASSVLISEPVESLRLLKIARDQDVQPNNLPVGSAAEISMGGVIGEVGRYYRYVLLNR